MKAAIIIHDGYTDCEFNVAYHYLLAFDFNVTVYSLNGGPVKGIQGWVHKESESIKTGWYPLKTDLLVLIGGVKAMEYLRQSHWVIDFIRDHNSQNKIIASICHGAQNLIQADVVRGRKVLGYFSIRTDLLNAGAIWPENETVCVDGNLVTAPHYNYSGKWIKAAVDRLWTFQG